jgi:hypothetical protein
MQYWFPEEEKVHDMEDSQVFEIGFLHRINHLHVFRIASTLYAYYVLRA